MTLPAFRYVKTVFAPFSRDFREVDAEVAAKKLLKEHSIGSAKQSNRDPHGYFLSVAALAAMAGLTRVSVPKTHSTQVVRKKANKAS